MLTLFNVRQIAWLLPDSPDRAWIRSNFTEASDDSLVNVIICARELDQIAVVAMDGENFMFGVVIVQESLRGRVPGDE